jgi:hypothetical protein
MVQRVTEKDGTIHEFPDDATPDEMDSALQSKAPAPSAAASTEPPIDFGAPPSAAAPAAPSTALQSAPSASPLQSPPWALGDLARIAGNTGTFGALDRATALANQGMGAVGLATEGADPTTAGQNVATQQARERQGPIASAAADIAGYTALPGKLFAPLRALGSTAPLLPRIAAGIGTGALEGGTAAGLTSATSAQPWSALPGAAETGATIGGVTGGVGGILAPARDYSGVPRTADLQARANQATADAGNLNVHPTDVKAAAAAASSDAAAQGMTELRTPNAHALLTDSGQRALPSFGELTDYNNNRVSVNDLLNYQSRANALTGNDAQYGGILSNHIDRLLAQGRPQNPNVPQGAIQDAAANSNAAQGMLAGSQYLDRYAPAPAVPGGRPVTPSPSVPPGTQSGTSAFADFLSSHAYKLAHAGIEGGAALAELGHMPYAGATLMGLGGAAGLSKLVAGPMKRAADANTLLRLRAQNAQIPPAATGAPWASALRNLTLGGAGY